MTSRALALVVTALALSAAGTASAGAAPVMVVLDSDGYADYDDVVGVMVAALSPELDLRGVIATGKDAEQRGRALAKALAITGRQDVPVYLGEASQSPEPDFDYMAQFPRRWYGLRPELERWAADFPYTPPAKRGSEFLIDVVTQHPGQVAVVVTGPLSTLARAMLAADDRGDGAAFRSAIGKVLFSGGDFKTVEYNVFVDVASARTVFGSGVPLYDLPGEGSGKAYLTHERRAAWWSARNPATNALEDLFRLYRAGWDPTSPYVPILYDVHPVAYLLRGEEICRFEAMHVEIDMEGRLLRAGGAPNANVRVANDGDRLVAWVTSRLTSPLPAALNHLRRIAEAGGKVAPEAVARASSLIERMSGAEAVAPAGVEPALRDLEARLASSGTRPTAPAWNAAMARGYLFGARPETEWRDPYTPRMAAAVIFANEALRVVTHPVVMTAGAVVALALFMGWMLVRRRKARQV